jgi:hypothetical protein
MIYEPLVDGQCCEKVTAGKIDPSPTDQTESFERFLVVPHVISDDLDKFLRKTSES